jgi:hypothetical protein
VRKSIKLVRFYFEKLFSLDHEHASKPAKETGLRHPSRSWCSAAPSILRDDQKSACPAFIVFLKFSACRLAANIIGELP